MTGDMDMMPLKPLKLEFNYVSTASRNEYAELRELTVTPAGDTKHMFPPVFEVKSSAIAAMPLDHSLSLLAYSLTEAARIMNPGQPLESEVDFIDEKGGRRSVAPATFTPH
jgi:hypothetical protein